MIDLDNTLASTDYLEYVVIGAQGGVWVVLLATYLLNIPLHQFATLNPVLLVIGLPFMYVLGLMVDTVSHLILSPVRVIIRNWQLGSDSCPDEYIGLHSPTLYAAYAWRARRPRIPGSATVNWLLIGISLLLHTGFTDSYETRLIIIVSLVTIVVTLFTWFELWRRAYKFRKNACQTIRESLREPVSVTA